MKPRSIKDGNIHSEVGLGSSPISISGNIDPTDISNSRAGIGISGTVLGGSPLAPSGSQVSAEVSIGKEGAQIEARQESPGGVQGGMPLIQREIASALAELGLLPESPLPPELEIDS